jgi:16S rRNA (guanine527-N7)-methyltransferase
MSRLDTPQTADTLNTLALAASQLSLDLSPSTLTQLLHHLNMVARWGRVYNLTAVLDGDDMLTHHLLDALSLVAPMQKHLNSLAPTRTAHRVLDVGSGAGFPGATLAITCPDIEVTCVDAVAKKASFIRQVAAELSLNNLSAQHGRIESLKPQAANIITCRAFASLNDFTQLTHAHLSENGIWVAMKGKVPDAEIAELPSTIHVFHVEPLHVPGLDAQRCLVWMKPQLST